jgi:hypothetical protein
VPPDVPVGDHRADHLAVVHRDRDGDWILVTR